MFKGKKVVFISLVLTLVLGLGYLLGELDKTTVVNAKEEEENINTINVNGEGIVKIKPDIAYINMGVETQNKDSKKAQEDNRAKMDKVIDELKDNGIKEDNIKTIEYSIITLREYDQINKKTIVTGYKVRNIVQVMIEDLDKVGEVIDSVSSLGANYIRNINFDTKYREKYYLQALELAMESAKNKAKTIGKTFGVEVDKPYKVTENSRIEYSVNNRVYMDVIKSEAALETPISSGELTIRASVNVIYKY
ncbi:SIMPL domain-containing protein [Thermohalobacter berrensis]|uniref:SIMPL domain-containing protein n=1 Tax=Thermohalobacter berrensis TaxID=99594 RepID=A0A419T6I3_9FIRM|nr:SIMPL domain-containing protein [Thermohalobacter berrensis]RKD33170.1 hypothetical protein BET03_09640 [Thermohalobacter berrensis]